MRELLYTRQNTTTIIVVPINGNRDLLIGTLKGILKDAGLNEDDI
ncbi:hypothetical protein myaer102_49140 [Microcystis viridis NIES-102]|uniref:YcfA family protein n=1 Tax=Microcystis viridis NIES-102 TaxID=213615 RepID=A0A3G9K7X1_MICVR|nr:type II toxin-antitoxin system HicA family toxin [Microcystis viridis]BBH42270.1 hypothetical protein myaer102_49140 [Microcystis viridis NIES-102]